MRAPSHTLKLLYHQSLYLYTYQGGILLLGAAAFWLVLRRSINGNVVATPADPLKLARERLIAGQP